jgi:hypothetical protein
MKSYSVDRKKWSSLSTFEQMGNIGSEIGRSLAAKRKGDEETARAAMVRALDLFDATAESWSVTSPARTRELQRAREEYLASITNPSKYNGIEEYFMNFAIAARLAR